MNHSTSKPTAAQKVRLAAISSMPCIACQFEKMSQPMPTEVHHIVDRGTRKHSGGHDATIPLCTYHHRGIVIDYMGTSEMKRVYGPSLALHKKEFKNIYGTERELLAEVDAILNKEKAA